MKKLIIRQITEKFLHIHNQLKILEKSSKGFGIDKELSFSELECIKAIGRHPGNNITELASRLGITKGAVSQMSVKLVGKKLVIKGKNPTNNKEIWLTLSEKGEAVFQKAEKFYYEMFAELDGKINKMSIEQVELIIDSFDLVKRYLKKRAEKIV